MRPICAFSVLVVVGLWLCVDGVAATCSVQNCQTCSDQSTCTQCTQNYTLSLNSCISCNITLCTSCQTPNTCSTCQQQYLPNTLGQYCSYCTVPDCQYSVMGNVCTQCQNASLSINSQNTECIFCNVSNCAICQEENLCYLCELGYEFGVGQVGYVCVMCGSIQGCLGCYGNMTCARCQTGYVLSNDSQSCILCPYPCATCNPGTTTCLTCLYPYSQTPTPSSICYTCQTPNCLACNYQNPSICLNCTTGYKLNSDSTACTYMCSSTCFKCNDIGSCLECFPGYVVSKDGRSCLQCSDGRACWKCYESNLTCFKCSQGFYLTTEQKCLSCPIYCATCNQNSCLTYKIASGQAAYNSNGSIVPAQCNPGCLSCFPTNPSACRQCQPGYYLNQNICTSCPSFCKTCLPSLTCLTCVYNAVLINGSCTQCNTSSNCQTCNPQNLTQCLTCPPTFSLSLPTSTCSIQCPQYCQQCQNSICTVCQQGYSPNLQGICLPCMANCSFCSGQVYDLCLRCSDGYFFSSGVCVACGQGCLECIAGGCVVCYGGFVLNSNFTCTAICSAPCATCSGGATLCTSCLAGYVLQGSSCWPQSSCIGGCSICPLGYSFSTTTTSDCQPCANSLCAICNNQTCLGCYNGQYLQPITKFCLACKAGCSTCTDPTICLTCSPGYTSLQPLTFPSITCIPCLYPCTTCFPTPTSCTNCLQGYYLQGGLCISSFNFGFSVVLQTTAENFYGNYQGFLGAIVQAGIQGGGVFSFANITMVSVGGSQVGQGRRLLTTPSLTVQGVISTTAASESQQAGNQYNNISQVLSKNSVIANMTVLHSTMSVNVGSVPPPPSPPIPPTPPSPSPQPQPQQSSSLSLILGIVIPIYIILKIGFIALYCERRRKQRLAQLNSLTSTFTPTSVQKPQLQVQPQLPSVTVEATAMKDKRMPTQDIQLEVSEGGRFSHL